jgi:7tm Odorant receptor
MGNFENSIAVFVPFVDPWTGYGITINSIYHMFCILLCGNGSLAADNAFIMFVIHFAASTSLFAVKIDELNEFVTMPDVEKNQRAWNKKVQEMIDDIMVAHQNIIVKIQDLDELFFTPIAVKIFTAVFSLAISLFLAATVSLSSR